VARQDNIQRSMPDFLDVLAVTVSAGLSFRLALARVAESMPGPLSDEFMVALRQMELGTPRREAFEDLRDRNNSEAVNQFVTAILQAEELGAPLGTTLVDIGGDLRRDSAQWAKRKAQRATPKITAITMAVTLPALMMVVLGALFIGAGVGSSGILGN
jgi:tight adherence protein C